ncbi:sun domain-containing protein 1 isoform X5 [Drosophila pseudoobscura]|uniref:Sun domain-containing protein 1 isoform X5 n=1 Tax=Drosophila pseudoobscura pseudoobscura TaxID=46245 RepID=A0A6I8VC14_DROPS|nr:sun domain-containing protein 1 isoform X5 [Drosophila pseudoobscura]
MTTTTQTEINTNGGGGVDSSRAGATETAATSSSVTPAPSGTSGLHKNAPGVGTPSSSRVLDATKRKKLKSRSSVGAASTQTTAAAAPSHMNRSTSASASKSNGTGPNYSKDHLDAWLENCLRDATNAQLSSSSEFLDFTPPTATANKQIFVTQTAVQQQQQQQQPQQQHQQQQQQQQQFLMRSHSQPYSMGTGTPFSLGIQRHSQALSHRYPMLFPPQSYPNGYGLGMGYCGDGGQEFASLPPLVNMMGGTGGATSEYEQNSTDVLNGSNPNFSRGFRFSDPCLLNPSDNDSKLSGQNTPDCRNGNGNGNTNTNDSGCDLVQQNKFFAALMEQINLLHDTNSKICRNLHETKGAYTPGMMTDVVREVKEAARVREDAMLSRVKSMVEERQWSLNEGNVRILRDIDDLKSHVMQLRLERKETQKRLSHLEAENKYLRQALASCYNQRQAHHDIIYENDRARGSRKPFPNGGGVGSAGAGPRRAQSFNLHYGIMHQTPTQTTHALDEDDELDEEQRQEQTEEDSEAVSVTTPKRLSRSSSESRSNGLPAPTIQPSQPPDLAKQTAQSPPTFALIAEHVDPDPALPPPLLPRKKEHAQLKRELSEAAAARKEANQRIIALEKLVRDLSVQVQGSQSNWNPTMSGAPPSTSMAAAARAAAAAKFSVADGPITDL